MTKKFKMLPSIVLYIMSVLAGIIYGYILSAVTQFDLILSISLMVLILLLIAFGIQRSKK